MFNRTPIKANTSLIAWCCEKAEIKKFTMSKTKAKKSKPVPGRWKGKSIEVFETLTRSSRVLATSQDEETKTTKSRSSGWK